MVNKKILTLLTIICAAAADESSQCPDIITAAQWGAKQARYVNYLIIPVQYVVIHQTVTGNCTRLSQCAQSITDLQSLHMDTMRWNDIGYSFLIGGDGNVYEGVGWIHEGRHTPNYDKKSIGIAFMGLYKDDKVNQVMVDAAHKLIAFGKAEKFLRSNVTIIDKRPAGVKVSLT